MRRNVTVIAVALAAVLIVATASVALPDTPAHVQAAHAAVDVLAADITTLEGFVAERDATIIDQATTIGSQTTTIAEQAARIAELEAQVSPPPSPSPTVPPSPTPAPCAGTPVASAAAITAAPAGATLCLTTEVRVGAPVVLKAGQILQGGGTLNGSVPLTGWTAQADTWSVGGQTRGPTVLCMAGLNPCDGTQMLDPSARFADDVFYDDQVLERFLTLAALRSAAVPGFFFDYAADTIHLNREPSGHTVELAVASGVIRSDSDGITLRDITAEKSTGTGIYFLGGQNWTVSNVTAQLNHGSGMRLGGGARVTDSTLVWNGMLGMGGSGSGLVVEGSEIAWNNHARYQKAPNGGCWSAGAMKWTHATVTFTGNASHDNWCDGFWADNDVSAVVSGNTITGNLRLGVFWELQNDGGTLHLFDNVIQGNGADGFRASDAGNALVERNIFGGNKTAFAASDSSRSGTPAGIVFRNNTLNGDATPGCSFAGVICTGNV